MHNTTTNGLGAASSPSFIDKPAGIYIHIPFCSGKCPYCDFYSVSPEEGLCEEYFGALRREIAAKGREILQCRGEKLHVDTVYFGGGTPPLLGADRLCALLDTVRRSFQLSHDSEITVEMNPRCVTESVMQTLHSGGFNRISMGAQSGCDTELRALGRRHSSDDIRRAVGTAKAAGFDNISLDLMLGIPHQTAESLHRSIDFLCRLAPKHISAYMLKLEPNTEFYRRADRLDIADDDTVSDMYLQAAEELAARGYAQYEISNFAPHGFESRHNMKYWDCGEYLGFGPAAHGFYGGRRYFYPRDIMQFIRRASPIDDGEGGSREEYAMLRLRLADGLNTDGWREHFGEELPAQYIRRAQALASAGLTECGEGNIRLTAKGFLLSNSVIGHIIG